MRVADVVAGARLHRASSGLIGSGEEAVQTEDEPRRSTLYDRAPRDTIECSLDDYPGAASLPQIGRDCR